MSAETGGAGSDPSRTTGRSSSSADARGLTPSATSGPGLGYHIVETGGTPLPGSLETNRRLSQWLRLGADGTVEVCSGKVEIGQGILTAVAQIVADELDVDLARIRMVAATTAASPNNSAARGRMSSRWAAPNTPRTVTGSPV